MKKKALIESLELKITEAKGILVKEMMKDSYSRVSDIVKEYKVIKEGFIDNHNGPLEAELDEIIRKLGVANRALGLTNKLKDPAQKREHQSRIMKHINRINKELAAVADQVYSPSPMSRGEFE